MFILSAEKKWMKEKNESVSQKTETFYVKLQFTDRKWSYRLYTHPDPIMRKANHYIASLFN